MQRLVGALDEDRGESEQEPRPQPAQCGTRPFAAGTNKAVADARVLGGAGSRPCVYIQARIAPGRARTQGPAITGQSLLQVEQAERRLRQYAPRLAAVVLFDIGTDMLASVHLERFHDESLQGVVPQLMGTEAQGPVAAYLGRTLFDSLSALHADGVVHRDVKLNNMFIARPSAGGDKPRLVLGDFDYAISTHGGAIHEQKGTPGYFAPEGYTTSAGGAPLSATGYATPADIWSAGVGLFALLSESGQSPFIAPGNDNVRPHLYDDFKEWHADVVVGGRLDMGRLMASAEPFASYFAPMAESHPEILRFGLERLLVWAPEARASAPVAAQFFAELGATGAYDAGAATAALDRLFETRTRKTAEARYAQADMKAAAEFLQAQGKK